MNLKTSSKIKPPTLALVTGASSGIGKALCYLLAKQGIHLIVSARQAAPLEQLQEELKDQVNVQIVLADLSKREERKSLIEQIHQQAPDLVINNAGFGLYGECLTYSTQEQMELLEVNGMAVLELTLEAARMLISKNKKGTILNISSAAGFQIFPEMAVYASSKTFVTYFSQALNAEVRPYGVNILTTCPGMVETRFQERASGSSQLFKGQEIGVMSVESVAQDIWQQIQNQDPLTIIDWRYRLMTGLSYLFPKSWVIAILKKTINQRIVPRTFIKINHE